MTYPTMMTGEHRAPGRTSSQNSMSLNAGLTDDRSLMPSAGPNYGYGTVPGHPRMQHPEYTPGHFPGNRWKLFGSSFSFERNGYGEIVNLATSFPPLTLPKPSTHFAHLPTRFSRACRVYGPPLDGAGTTLEGARCMFRCRCRSRYVSTHHPRHRNETIIIKIDHSSDAQGSRRRSRNQ